MAVSRYIYIFLSQSFSCLGTHDWNICLLITTVTRFDRISEYLRYTGKVKASQNELFWLGAVPDTTILPVIP